MNSAYKHLDNKLRLAGLALGQWFGVMVGVGLAILWGFYVSPLPTYPTIGSAVYLGAVPAGLALLSTFYEIDVGIVMRSAIVWWRLDGRFIPGAGPQTQGYVVCDERIDERDTAFALSNLDPAALWES